MTFAITHRSSTTAARRGSLVTPHGVVETPVFMPVGTQGSVKGISQQEVAELGFAILLGNTYHLHLRPGEELVRRAGGLRQFMGWDGAILTDSGGFQVFSLQHLRKVTDDGVLFQSHIDGSQRFFTPESVVDIQRALGSDIMMVLDECVANPCSHEVARRAMERTHAWARRSIDQWQRGAGEVVQGPGIGAGALQGSGSDRTDPSDRSDPSSLNRCPEGRPPRSLNAPASATPPLLFGIVQGSRYPDLRAESAAAVSAIGFPGIAIGGVSVGEPQAEMYAVVEQTAPLLPADRPRYLMGVGTPQDVLMAIGWGVDMFDCVLPTRLGRTGTAYTGSGRINVKAARFAEQFGPIDPDCEGWCCRHYSAAYLRHLYHAKEMLVARVLTYHNLHFYARLLEDARRAIEEDRFEPFRAAFLARFGGEKESE